MKIQCPHCGVKGSADDSYCGQKVKCPKCQGVFEVVAPVSKVSPEDPVQATSVEKQAEPSAPISQVLPEDRQERSEPQVDVTDGAVAADSGSLNEDLAAILVAEEVPENDQSQIMASAEPVVDGEDDVLAWQDIASEIDKEMAEDSKLGREQEGSSAILHDFFESAAPVVDDLGKPVVEQRGEELVEADSPAGDEPHAIAEPPISSGLTEEEQGEEKTILDGVENQPYGVDKEQCWQCGKKDTVGVPFMAEDGRLYCPDCLPPEAAEHDDLGAIPQGSLREGAEDTDTSPREPRYGFTIGGLLKEAWAKTKGAKATVWVGSSVMYLTLIVLVAGGSFLLPSQGNQYVGINMAGMLGNVLFQMITNAVSVIFSAGLIYIGIRKVAGATINWKMVFEGFSVAGKLIVATILQTLLVGIGFLLLILPGIYLAIGYSMTVPLIVERKMSPWQAMEASRKAIHGEWWKIFGLFLVMGILLMISLLPLGLGLIWTWPMFVVLGGVVYRSLFGIEKRVG